MTTEPNLFLTFYPPPLPSIDENIDGGIKVTISPDTVKMEIFHTSAQHPI